MCNDGNCWYCEDVEYKKEHGGRSMWQPEESEREKRIRKLIEKAEAKLKN